MKDTVASRFISRLVCSSSDSSCNSTDSSLVTVGCQLRFLAVLYRVTADEFTLLGFIWVMTSRAVALYLVSILIWRMHVVLLRNTVQSV